MTVVLVALWLPVSSHSLLQNAGLIHLVHADHEHDSDGSHEHDADNHDAADGKCALSSTHVSVPVSNTAATPFLLYEFGLEWTSEFHVGHLPSGLAPPGTAPPQLSNRWQFSFRTALLARAPSLIS
ncbi:MAG: hypothetical protein HOP33_12665 [Verrucomicrobia bacterium]|nr:hypothetical protein [Verrucomicrobiota bacterium]